MRSEMNTILKESKYYRKGTIIWKKSIRG